MSLPNKISIKSYSSTGGVSKQKIFNKLLRFFFRNGGVFSKIKAFLGSFSFFFYFLNNQNNLNINLKDYLNAQEFTFILKTTGFYKNIPTLLQWVTSLNHSQFDLNVQKVSKKYKKKVKKKYFYKINYLSKKKQLNRVLK